MGREEKVEDGRRVREVGREILGGLKREGKLRSVRF